MNYFKIFRPIYFLIISITIIHSCTNKTAPDVIFVNGKIFSSDSTMLWAEALAIRGDRIVATGTNSSIRQLANDETKIIDLEHHVVVPGFNDAHAHAGPDPISRIFFNSDESYPPDFISIA
jgi:adenine deaminase